MAKDNPSAISSVNTSPVLTRWYLDTRHLTASTTALPLLETLQATDQTAVQKYYHVKDKHMSLASNLLKYLFIHQTCRVPWSSIVISRTPDPHRRPCYIPPADSQSGGKDTVVNVEFNVSHQASMVAIAGTTISPDRTPKPEVGVDITCVNERQGRKGEERSLDALHKYIDIFSEVFSAAEMDAMRSLHGAPSSPSLTGEPLVEYGYRLFYTYWALKEAYIKMTGEALLAPWLRELEFSNVIAPAAVAESGEVVDQFGEPYTGVKTALYKDVVQDVRIEVAALDGDYLFATAARGGELGAGSQSGAENESQDPWMPFEKLDIERDIRPCATGVCNCLS
ncbi:4'-phosphopantetheinyl transferase family protein [Aspergillus mulundensis]|uniref:holo-[acyl-carrier-protein] synthase n=1 Tax=Aspergillus mulundensis TaxID=1810919 RepID=A0A3D8SW74_9EURO|nr:Uncharacterized protein DSM5745_02284 [Aspergillus mulundensis]RDW90509.1 Uncharacterized protein DSM5745_02284 [Aspergillus mulundensis]